MSGQQRTISRDGEKKYTYNTGTPCRIHGISFPSIIRIAGMEWQIIAAPGFQDITEAAGMTFHSAGHIIIDSEFGEPRYTADTIVHEILHACWANTPLTSSKKPTEEDVVRGLTPGITTVFLDNPEFYSAMRRLWRKGAK